MGICDIEIVLDELGVFRMTGVDEPAVDERAEEQPVGLGKHFMVNLIHPAQNILLLLIGDMIPEFRLGLIEKGGDGSHFHKDLIIISQIPTPVIRVGGISAIDQAFGRPLPPLAETTNIASVVEQRPQTP